MRKFMLVMQLGGLVMGWFARAAMDGKLTPEEIVELMTEMVGLYEEVTGKKIEIELSTD